MKHIFLTIALGLSAHAHAQWKTETMNHPIDGAYKIAYTPTVNGAYLKMFQYQVDSVYEAVGLLLGGKYTCTEAPEVQIAFNIGGTWITHTVTGETSKDSHKVYLTIDIISKFGNNFAGAKQVMIRVNDEHCGTDTYIFSMTGSSAALNFMRKPL